MILDTLSINKSTRFIGRIPQYDKNKKYESLSFCIEDSVLIMKTIRSLKIGSEIENRMGEHEFYLTLINQHEEIMLAAVDPEYNSIRIEGHSYTFDATQINNLSELYPFKYRYKKEVFKSKAELVDYVEKQKKDSSYLFGYLPLFRFEGSFEMEFPRNDIYSSPAEISRYLYVKISEVVNDSNYSVYYELTDKNLFDFNQMTMKISGSKLLYDKLVISGVKKFEWKPSVEEGWFFYRIDP
jgi:hypothetical protein